MPTFEDIVYSRKGCIDAVRRYYKFLVTFYLDDSLITEPPVGGWPSVTTDVLGRNKTEEVVALLRHLPYIQRNLDPEAAPWCRFANWQKNCTYLASRGTTIEDLKVTTEDPEICDRVPADVVGLTQGGRGNPVFLLDTAHGIIHWYECPSEIYGTATQEQVEEDPYEYAPEEEAEWRTDCAAWPVDDFFEVLKDQFRALKFIPIGSTRVIDIYATLAPDSEGMVTSLQKIYREHGWPDAQRYRKKDCLKAVQELLLAHYPTYAETQ
ncbi:Nn.00g061120.m01.CDS01 [Neocucurbitaria sp. VM-36]